MPRSIYRYAASAMSTSNRKEGSTLAQSFDPKPGSLAVGPAIAKAAEDRLGQPRALPPCCCGTISLACRSTSCVAVCCCVLEVLAGLKDALMSQNASASNLRPAATPNPKEVMEGTGFNSKHPALLPCLLRVYRVSPRPPFPRSEKRILSGLMTH